MNDALARLALGAYSAICLALIGALAIVVLGHGPAASGKRHDDLCHRRIAAGIALAAALLAVIVGVVA